MEILLLIIIWAALRKWERPYFLRWQKRRTHEEEELHNKAMKHFLKKYPNSLAKTYYPKLVSEIEALQEYKDLVKSYELGNIDEIDFQIKAVPLLEKIDIDDL